MKAKDIIVGEHYAVGSPNYPDRVVVLEVGKMSKRVFSGARWVFSGHDVEGIYMRGTRLKDDGSPIAHPVGDDVFSLSQVRHPWAKQVEVNAAQRAREDAARVAAATAGSLASELQAAGVGAGIQFQASARHGFIEVRINQDAARKLLDLLLDGAAYLGMQP